MRGFCAGDKRLRHLPIDRIQPTGDGAHGLPIIKAQARRHPARRRWRLARFGLPILRRRLVALALGRCRQHVKNRPRRILCFMPYIGGSSHGNVSLSFTDNEGCGLGFRV